MKRVTKLILPVLILVNVSLVYSGFIDARDAVPIVVAMEALVLLFGLTMVFFAMRRYRRGRSGGLDGWAALEEGLAGIMPRTAARLITLEPRLFVSLVRWTLRLTTPRENEFAYHNGSRIKPFAIMVVLASPAELLIVHVLALAFSPWAWVKWALLALGIYGVLWMVGIYASLPTTPHRLGETGLRIRYGVHVGAFVPYSKIREVERVRRGSPQGSDGLHHVQEEDETYIAVGGKTDLALRLETPLEIQGFLKKSAPAKTIRLAANDPKEMEEALRQRVEAAASGVPDLHEIASGR